MGFITTAATRSLETAASGCTPNRITRIGVMSAPPPMPVRPTTTPTIRPARLIQRSRCTGFLAAVKTTELIEKHRVSTLRGQGERSEDLGKGGLRGAGDGGAGRVPPGRPVKAEALAASQDIPRNFLDNILSELRAAGLVRTLRGPEGGSMLGRPAKEITAGRGAPGGGRPARGGAGRPARGARIPGCGDAGCPRCGSRCGRTSAGCSSGVTLADLAGGKLPGDIARLAKNPDAWLPH